MRSLWLLSLAVTACGTAPARQPPRASPPPPPRAALPAAPSCVAVSPAKQQRGFAGFGSHRRETGASVCQPADDNLARAEDAILALPAPVARAATPSRATPVGLDAIARRFGLSTAERQHLDRDGFVVAGRLAQPSYGWAYHEIYQSQLPIYISLDSILHALYATHDHLVANLERTALAPQLVALIARLHCALASQRLPPEVARDADLYLTVARRLLENKASASALGDAGVEREATALVAELAAAGPMRVVHLFGRDRMLDFSQYQPRGHYTEDLAPYFRGAMWLSRLELNLVSRSSRSSAPALDPAETPREERLALALTELVDTAGEADHLAALDGKLAVLAGRREDVTLAELRAFHLDPRDADAPDKLRAAIGDRFQRTARIHYMPEGAGTLPAIATLLGPRIVADAVALRPLAHGETPGRDRVRAGDLAFLAGNARGKTYLAADLEAFPTLATQLDRARELLQTAPRTPDLYTAWLDAIRALAIVPTGTRPRFMTTTAFADLRLDTTIAALAQLKHDHVLIAGQAYGEGGCEIPDGYVEPAPEVYDAIARYAELGAGAFGGDYFPRLGRLAHVLGALSRIELANQPLPAEAKQFLSMVTEILPYGSDGRPTYTGWYFDLFDDRSDAIAHADLVADYFTSGEGRVAYVGVRDASLGVFIVDTGGPPRAMIGPVAHAYEYASAATPRLDDARAATVTGIEDPWTASYTVPARPEPSFRASPNPNWDGEIGYLEVILEAKQALGKVTVEALDHHRVRIGPAVTRTVGAGKTVVRLGKLGEDFATQMIHIEVGGFHAWLELQCMDGCRPGAYGSERAAPGPAE